jgi:hypothetical protein
MMKEIGLVTMKPKGNFRVYSFNAKALYGMNKDLLSRERLAALVPAEASNSEAKVLKNFVRDGRIVQIPTGNRRLQILLRWLVRQFEYDRRYTEKEVNEIILRYHEDYASLRRYLVGSEYMTREKGIYWRLHHCDVDQDEVQTHSEVSAE